MDGQRFPQMLRIHQTGEGGNSGGNVNACSHPSTVSPSLIPFRVELPEIQRRAIPTARVDKTMHVLCESLEETNLKEEV